MTGIKAYDNTNIWYEIYTGLIERIERHVTHSKLAATKFEMVCGDQSACISRKTDAIVGLTALAEIHVALDNALDHPESRRQAVNAAIEIVSISDGLPPDRYDLLDHLLLVRYLLGCILISDLTFGQLCWRTAREILEQEQARLLAANGEDDFPQTAVGTGTISSLLTSLRCCVRRLRTVAPFGQCYQ